jgi:hypothetical protein
MILANGVNMYQRESIVQLERIQGNERLYVPYHAKAGAGEEKKGMYNR